MEYIREALEKEKTIVIEQQEYIKDLEDKVHELERYGAVLNKNYKELKEENKKLRKINNILIGKRDKQAKEIMNIRNEESWEK